MRQTLRQSVPVSIMLEINELDIVLPFINSLSLYTNILDSYALSSDNQSYWNIDDLYSSFYQDKFSFKYLDRIFGRLWGYFKGEVVVELTEVMYEDIYKKLLQDDYIQAIITIITRTSVADTEHFDTFSLIVPVEIWGIKKVSKIPLKETRPLIKLDFFEKGLRENFLDSSVPESVDISNLSFVNILKRFNIPVQKLRDVNLKDEFDERGYVYGHNYSLQDFLMSFVDKCEENWLLWKDIIEDKHYFSSVDFILDNPHKPFGQIVMLTSYPYPKDAASEVELRVRNTFRGIVPFDEKISTDSVTQCHTREPRIFPFKVASWISTRTFLRNLCGNHVIFYDQSLNEVSKLFIIRNLIQFTKDPQKTGQYFLKNIVEGIGKEVLHLEEL